MNATTAKNPKRTIPVTLTRDAALVVWMMTTDATRQAHLRAPETRTPEGKRMMRSVNQACDRAFNGRRRPATMVINMTPVQLETARAFMAYRIEAANAVAGIDGPAMVGVRADMTAAHTAIVAALATLAA